MAIKNAPLRFAHASQQAFVMRKGNHLIQMKQTHLSPTLHTELDRGGCVCARVQASRMYGGANLCKSENGVHDYQSNTHTERFVDI
jgi:hypothetical protein